MLRPDGAALIATNGRGHLCELWEIRAEVFPHHRAIDDETVEVFGLEVGEPMVRERFGQVELRPYPDRLRCTDPADVLAFLTSSPPGADATPAELVALTDAIAERFERGAGVFEVTKAVGVFVCRGPLAGGTPPRR